jgi:CheY-like chemotaxis protein
LEGKKPPSGGPVTTAPVPGTIKVLLADDNVVNQMVGRKMLESLGAQVTIARDGVEAVAVLEREPFDVVFMDCQMPELDGYKATAAVRVREQRDGGHVPIIALTASAMPRDHARSLAAGMDGHLTKPLDLSRLKEELVRWTRRG